MTAQWSPVDDATASLLTLVATDPHPSSEHEWHLFTEALVTASLFDGIVRPNDLRPLIRGRVAPKRIGAFTHRALSEGLIEPTGEYQISDDREGRNGGRPMRIFRRKKAIQ